MIDERLEGFTFGERITPNVGNVLVEKTNFAIPGSAQFLFREFAKLFADCTYITSATTWAWRFAAREDELSSGAVRR